MSDTQDQKVLEQRISLPKPDVDNITVLTKNLPNEPILPWHRFDSPWLEREASGEPEDTLEAPALEERGSPEAESKQLTLEVLGAAAESTSAEAAEISEAAPGSSDSSSQNATHKAVLSAPD